MKCTRKSVLRDEKKKLFQPKRTATKLNFRNAASGPNPDDVMASCYTDSGGRFDLHGNSYELSTIDPEVRIYHDCNDYGRPCQREWIIRIPDRYVSSGAVASRTMELGELNLEVELEDEDQECVHN
ncbi:unnamed protein product [Gongylonema pulchrum]|uniref:Transthyretin-like family protein n=1 Tax=Gongylonema pulchrum TaxID=637853 RepID=A0A183CZJ9_9BILA|nr:unnamed protein product [Gongylonema pulchrum]